MESDVIFSTKDLQFKFSGYCHSIKHHDVQCDIPVARGIRFEICLTIYGDVIGFFKFPDKFSMHSLNQKITTAFDLQGEDEANYYKIHLNGTVISSFQQERNEFRLNFHATDLLLTHNLERRSQKLEFECGLTNVFDLSRYVVSHEVRFSRNDIEDSRIPIKHPVKTVTVTTTLGQLTMDNYDEIFKNAEIMRNLKIPLITACIKTELNNSIDLHELINKVQKNIEEFLKITSFVQSCRHDQVFVLVKQQGHPFHIKISRPRKNIPFWLPLTNYTTADLYSELWKNYSEHIEEEYNFGVALDWYLGAIALEQIETKFVYASTALECLLAKSGQKKGTANILGSNDFTKFRTLLLPAIQNALDTIGLKVGTNTHNSLFEYFSKRLNELNRHAYADKVILMLDNLAITYSDLGDKQLILRLITLRNKIIHVGELKYVSTEIQLQEANDDFKRLISLICRIFLRILGYHGEYYDIFHKKVCSI